MKTWPNGTERPPVSNHSSCLDVSLLGEPEQRLLLWLVEQDGSVTFSCRDPRAELKLVINLGLNKVSVGALSVRIKAKLYV